MQAVVNKKLARLELLERHIERLEKRVGQLSGRHQGMLLRLVLIFVGGIFVSAIGFSIFSLLGLACVIAAIGWFVYDMRVASALSRSVERYTALLRVKEEHVARMRLDWENIPPVVNEREEDHPFENDLQVSGPRSLHRLINTCYSDEGRARLRQWLLNRTPDVVAIRTRQAVVRELISLARFRDLLQLYSRRVILDVEKQDDTEALLMWLDMPGGPRPPLAFLIISSILSAILIILFILMLYGHMSLMYVAGAFAVSLLWSLPMARYRARLFVDTSLMYEIFKQLYSVFSYLEKYPYGNHVHLKDLCGTFQSADVRPSRLLKRLRFISRGAMVTQNQVMQRGMTSMMQGTNQLVPTIVNAIVPWDLILSYMFVQCKEDAKEHLPRWLDAWYELEALCSLANFAYLNPDYAMPEFLEEKQPGPALRAIRLGHPLIPHEERIDNNVTIEYVGDIMLITGSNMAGKSTFLRTLGVNLCLAYAGSVVNATAMCTGLYEVHCCISVSDSLVDGYSYFYAEVRRLKFILDRLREKSGYPVFVLIDEIFRGTNNRERSIGSHAYIYALAEANCIGAISTHDLELVTLAEELPQIKNYHFREEIVKGEMIFDYRLYTGPCPTTNALKIMQKEGLPITWKRAPASA